MIKNGCGNNNEFQTLQKNLEHKSNQITNLRAEIASSQNFGTKNQMENMELTMNHHGRPAESMKENPILNQNSSTDTLLRSYQQHIEDLQRKLRITTEMCAEQDVNYKNAFTDAESKFRRSLQQRDEFIKLRESESNNQQQLITHLQTAMEKLELEKVSFLNELESVNSDLKNATKLLEEQDKELHLSKECFQDITMILVPDLRKLSNESVDVDLFNASKLLEKALLLHQKEREILDVKILNLENKLLENEKVNSEKLAYEKKLIEVQYKEHKNSFDANIELKEKEINNLNSKLKTFENEMLEAQEKHSNELEQCKQNMLVFRANEEEKYELVCKEKDEIQRDKSDIETELQKTLKTIHELSITLRDSQEKVSLKDTEIMEKNEQIEECLKKCENLQAQLDVIKLEYSQHKTSVQSEMKNLKKQLLSKSNQCEEILKDKNELQEKLLVIPKEVEREVSNTEKEKYDKELGKINAVVENHKFVLQNANHDLQQKEEMIKKREEEIQLLKQDLVENEKKLYLLQNKVDDRLNDVNQKDNRIINLQLKLSEFHEQLKASKDLETISSKKLENVQLLSDDYQMKVRSYEEQLRDLRQTEEEEKIRCAVLEKELENITSILSFKNNEIERLQKDIKSIAKKLKNKHEQTTQQRNECRILEERNKQLEQKLSSVDQKYQNVMIENERLLEELKSLEAEKNTMQKLMYEQEDVKEKEIMSLLNRLHGSEADISKLKRILKSYRLTDSKAVKYASAAQNIVTKQRAEVDSLKTKVAWLKDALEVSEQSRVELQEKSSHKSDTKDQLVESQKRNKRLSITVQIYKQEIIELQKALEQTASKYSEICEIVEQQERCLRDEGQLYDHKLKELQKTLRKPLPLNYIAHIGEEYDAAAMLNSSVVKISTVELRHLLEDVKSLLSSTLKKNSLMKEDTENKEPNKTKNLQNSVVIPNKLALHTTKDVSNEVQNDSKTKEKHEDPNIKTTLLGTGSNSSLTKQRVNTESFVIVSPQTGSNTARLDEYLSKQTLSESSLSFLTLTTTAMLNREKLQPTSTPKEVSTPKYDRDMIGSLYSNVSYSEDTISVVTDHQSGVSNVLRQTTDKVSSLSSAERLQLKLLSLQQMGEDLTSNNKEFNDIMKQHSNKLKQLDVQQQ